MASDAGGRAPSDVHGVASRRRRVARVVSGAGLAALVGLTAHPAGAQLTLHVTVGAGADPRTAPMYVAGSFNGWNPAAPEWMLRRDPDGTYEITLPDSIRGRVEFKFTLGSWERVEVAADGTNRPNRVVEIPSAGAVTHDATVAAWRSSDAGRARRSTASPSVSALGDSIFIPQLGRWRRAWLYLPPGYSSSRRRYPVLYMHDGQNVFDASTSFAGEWGVDETLDSLHAAGDRGAIVVAIENGGAHRLDEYNPWRSEKRDLGGGEGDAYLEFLVHDLKPWVDRHYRTIPDPGHTGILGSSMGGLISFYGALRYPHVFGLAGIFSPSFWVADPAVFTFARAARLGRRRPRLYFSSGASETPEGQPARDQVRMVELLRSAGIVSDGTVRSLTPADGKHAEWFWRREFPSAYLWLFTERRGRQGTGRAHRGSRAH